MFVVCPSPTSSCWVYPSGRYYRLSQSLIFPCTRYPSRSQVLFPWPASAVTSYLQLEKELGPVVGPLLSLFMHWRGGDEVNGRQWELGGAQMYKFYRNKNKKTVPNCVKFVDCDTSWDSEVWYCFNSKRHLSGHRDIALMNTCVPINLKEILQSDQTSNERQVVFSKILHSRVLLFEQEKKVCTESCRFLLWQKFKKKNPKTQNQTNPDTF